MLIYALLFIIILLYVYESLKIMRGINKKSHFMNYTDNNNNNINMCNKDTIQFKSFMPLLYKYKGNLFEKLEKFKEEYGNDEKYRKMYENEMRLYKWLEYRFKEYNNEGILRNMNDIITDYNPEIKGQQRPWMELYAYK